MPYAPPPQAQGSALQWVLNRKWYFPQPGSRVQKLHDDGVGLWAVREDLQHDPLLGGNKFRKLDGLISSLLAENKTDVVRSRVWPWCASHLNPNPQDQALMLRR